MANKGLWVDLNSIDELWVTAYKPLGHDDVTVVQLASGKGMTLKVLRMMYSEKGVAVFMADRLPQAVQYLKEYPEEWVADDYLEILKAGLSVPALWIPGPIKATITKVSNKHGVIALHGNGGSIRIWERAMDKKGHRFYRHEWGIEARLGDEWFTKRGAPGKVIKLEKLLNVYNRLAAMYKVMRWNR